MNEIIDKIKLMKIENARKKFMKNLEMDEKVFASFIIDFIEIPEIKKALLTKDINFKHFLIKTALESMRSKKHPLITDEQLENF